MLLDFHVSECVTLTLNFDLIAGSSKHGKNVLAYTGSRLVVKKLLK